MQKEQLISVVEALIFSSDRSLGLKKIEMLIDDVSQAQIQEAINGLEEKYKSLEHGIYLENVAGGYQFRTKVDAAPWLKKLMESKPIRMSRAQLETVSIVAYKQPVTRIEVDAIRGVDGSHILRMLLDRKLIKIVGVKEVPGRPLLYGTTDEFLEFFNLKDLTALPTLEQVKELKDEEPTTDMPLFQTDTLPDPEGVEKESRVDGEILSDETVDEQGDLSPLARDEK